MSHLPSLGPRGEGWVLLQGVLFVLVGAAGWSLGPDWPGPLRFVGTVVGIVFVGGGLALAGRGVVDLGNDMTPVPKPREDARLVDTGVYRVVRHPIYGGVMLVALGWAIARASVVAVAFAGVLAVFLLLKSTREEAWLSQQYPDYAAYRARTRRLIPWPR